MVRARRPTVWFWRLASVGLLAPWGNTWSDGSYLPPPPTAGMTVWAFGSLMIGVSAWIAPPRIAGEPWFTWTLLRRDAKGLPLTDFKPPPQRPAFPVVVDPPPDG